MIGSHLSSWTQQKHFNVLAAAPRALVLPDQVSRRVGAHARIRRPDLTESTHTTDERMAEADIPPLMSSQVTEFYS